MAASVDVAVIGAGPYGLSVASHLQSAGIEFRIFGIPMDSWIHNMPPQMFLKSDGLSSDLSDPNSIFTLKAFCAQNGFEHHDSDRPIPIKTFIEYGLAFQKRFVPQVERRLLVSLERVLNGFILRFGDGEDVAARRIIVSVGIQHFSYIPDALKQLPADVLTHSSQHGPIDNFRGQRVAVLGAGASALDLAAFLLDQGADVSVLARRSSIVFHARPIRRALWRHLVRPSSGIGNGWRLRIFSDAPQVFRILPFALRRRWAPSLLGPSTGWFMKDKIVGRVPVFCGFTPQAAKMLGGSVQLHGRTLDGRQVEFIVDRIVAATGFKIDLRRLGFIGDKLRAQLWMEGDAPVLSSEFETSVPGLHIIGPASMHSFGPVARFVYGDRYTAVRIAKYFANSPIRRLVAAQLSVAS